MIPIYSFKKDYTSCNILGLEVVTTGPIPGDSGHGGFVEIKLINHGGSDMRVNGEHVDQVSIYFGGGSEYETLLLSLKDTVKFMETNFGEKNVG
jgi:hypothetical protein